MKLLQKLLRICLEEIMKNNIKYYLFVFIIKFYLFFIEMNL